MYGGEKRSIQGFGGGNLREKYHLEQRFSNIFFKWGPLSLVRMFYGPPYSWDYQTH